MSRKSSYRAVLVHLVNRFLKTDNEEDIEEYLSSNSNLPGPRGNLELAFALIEVAEDSSAMHPNRIWSLASRFASVSVEEAPVNDPKEFLPFCGAVMIGVVGSVQAEFFRTAFTLLKKLANDARWRTREGVAMGIQRLIAKRGQSALNELDGWVAKNEWFVMRAVAAGVAEPVLLRDESTAKHALELHKKIFALILATGERKTIGFRALRQTLGYSLSVVICAAPRDGFEYLQRLAESHDADILWVTRENLKKNRLIENFPNDVMATKRLLA